MAERWRELAPGLAVAALLILAMAGVFAYERGQFGEYPIEWSESSEVAEESATGQLTEGQTENHTFAIESEGVARAVVRLTWTDDVGAPDTLRLEVHGPNGLAGGPVETTGGTLELDVRAATQPAATNVAGRSAADALAQADGSAGANGTGDWHVLVTLAASPGEAGNLAGIGAQADGANDYDVRFAYTLWQAGVAEGG